MISEYESYAVEAMLGFYNNDFDQFLEFLDENVIWYGPKQGQYVVGKENLKNSVCVKKPGLSGGKRSDKTDILYGKPLFHRCHLSAPFLPFGRNR